MSIKKTLHILKKAYHLEKKGNKKEAFTLYKTILETDETNPFAHNNLAAIYHENNDAGRAEFHYRKAIDSKQNFTDAMYNLGILLKQQDRKQEAVDLFEDIMKNAKKRVDKYSAKEELHALTGYTYEKCDICGCISLLGSQFTHTACTSICPGCFERRSFFHHAYVILIISCFFIFLFALVFSQPGITFRPVIIIINMTLILISNILMIVLHEGAHALVYALLHGRIFEIVTGTGPLILRKLINKRMFITIRKTLNAGLCAAVFPVDGKLRFRIIMGTSAGIVFHLFVLLVILFTCGFSIQNIGIRIALCEVVCISSFLNFLFSLYPRQIKMGLSSYRSDGLALWEYITKGVNIVEYTKNKLYIECVYALRLRRFNKVVDLCDHAPYDVHTDLHFLIVKANAIASLGKENEAIHLLEKTKEHREKENYQNDERDRFEFDNVYLFNNLAYFLLRRSLISGECGNAMEYARYAYERLPWNPSIQGTYGFSLLQHDRTDEGLFCLRQSFRNHENTKNKAITAALCALACYRKNEMKEARTFLEKAVSLDPDEITVQRVIAVTGGLTKKPHSPPSGSG
ncbi:MAG: tetratricopeptide repeat protein [Spirochaetales bacterium]|nr:tetratricopeptide repeat protein [Spirochaetales bacterium]